MGVRFMVRKASLLLTSPKSGVFIFSRWCGRIMAELRKKRRMKRNLLLMLLLGFIAMCLPLHAQQFAGVYMLQEPLTVLILKSTKAGYRGFISDGQKALRVAGKMKDDVCVLQLAEGEDKTENYARLDGSGNLFLADGSLNSMYFTRSDVDPVAAYAEIDSLLKATAGVQQSSANTAKSSAAGSPDFIFATAQYANKKFLHVYTGNGFSEKWAYYLFDNGTFYFKSNASYLSGDAYADFSAATASNEGGRWTVECKGQQETLVLNWNSGEQGRLLIQHTSGGYLLGKTKYFLVGLNEYE